MLQWPEDIRDHRQRLSARSKHERFQIIRHTNDLLHGHSRPRKVKTLANTINTLFTKKLEEAELMSLINELQKKHYIVVSEGNVSYKLPH